MSLVARSEPLTDDRPLVDFLPPAGGFAWVRGVGAAQTGMVGIGEAVRLETGRGPDRFARAAAGLARLADEITVDDAVGRRGSGLVAMTSFTFDDGSAGSAVVVPEVAVWRAEGRTWWTRVAERDRLASLRLSPVTADPDTPPPDRVRYAGSSIPDVHWLDAVAQAITRIRDGVLDKVVLARDHAVWSKQPFEARVLAARLNRRFPECYTFLIDGLVGATPELLVRRDGTRVEALPLAGSARRGDDAEEDRRVGAALLASEKDRWEHALAVGSVVDALRARCEELDADREPFLLRLDNVQHLATRVTGRLRTTETALELAGALHPTAAVGGIPTDRAVAAIRELERMDRGRYSGPVGWVDAVGDGEFGIALRCAELSGARARLFAGAGIVAGSLPEDELEETRLKLRAMESALDPTGR